MRDLSEAVPAVRSMIEHAEQQVPEVFRLGDVSFTEVLPAAGLGISPERTPRLIQTAQVTDPYVERYPADMLAAIQEGERQADAGARQRRLAGQWQRQPGTAYSSDGAGSAAVKGPDVWGDPETSAAYFAGLGSPAADAWRKLIPSAMALLHLSDPDGFPEVVLGEERVTVDAVARRGFSLNTDSIAIRSRASVMAALVQSAADESIAVSDVRWMSVACGTALPAMKAAVQAGIEPNLLLVDIDPQAMALATSLAKQLELAGTVVSRRLNIFNHRAMVRLRDELAGQGSLPQLIDLMGIFEYTGPNLGVDPVSFLRAALDCLADGGRLILGQMRSDRN